MDTGTEDMMEDPASTEMDVVGIAQDNSDFSTLVAALQEADLVETLQGDGPFTVFAPTNEAFEALLTELDITQEELLSQPDLESVLTYHVIPQEVMSGDLEDGMSAETVNGEEVTFDLSGDDPMINESTITSTDMEASNGVVHVIDAVMVPSDFELQ
ncbi:MAG TPA: Nex18 symbiotically induced protein [Alkalibacterium sp.]|nr:Nex18 symbiotically induced protein [Alkalibacterium sp.]